MLKSKPIGWITAGTLVCLAGVALACRLRDGKGTSPEANASPWSAQEDIPAVKLAPRGTIVASQARLALAKPQKPAVGEKVEDRVPVPADPPSAATAVMPPPPPPSDPPSAPAMKVATEPTSAVVPAPDAPAVPETSAPPAPPSVEKADSAPASAVAPPEPVKSIASPSEKPVPEAPAKAPAAEVVSKPADPIPTPTPPPAEISEKKAASPPMAEVTADTPPAPAASPEVGSAVSAVIPKDAPAACPTPTPVATTPPPSEKPMPTPPSASAVAGEPTYKVGDKGETLREIAKRTLGSEERWAEIDKLNPELRSQGIIPAGKVVRLPAEARGGWNVPGETETQGMPPMKAMAVRPLPVVRTKRAAIKAKTSAPLTGTYSCKLDGKRGMVLPKEVCEQLDKAETMLLTPGPDQCLWLGTQASAARVLERVEKSGAADQEIQTFRRLYYSQSEKAVLDGSGKLAISEKLAEYAGLGKEIVLIGIDDHFELWDAARWQRYSQHKDASPKP